MGHDVQKNREDNNMVGAIYEQERCGMTFFLQAIRVVKTGAATMVIGKKGWVVIGDKLFLCNYYGKGYVPPMLFFGNEPPLLSSLPPLRVAGSWCPTDIHRL